MHVPYKGTGPGITDLIAGRISLTSASVISAMEFVKQGKLRALATVGAKRASAAPELPTVAEAGVPGYAVDVWYAMFAPAALPKDILARLNGEIAKILYSPDVKERLAVIGLEPVADPLERTNAYINAEVAKWAKVVKAANITTNPHDPMRTPGGSSSGSAAAVGAGMLPVALGTQTQGSTLRPASYCGAVGFKPTHGVLPMQGVHPISASHDHLGVIGATLEDTWRIASHISLAHGSPGQPFLDGAAAELPLARQPRRLIRLYTRGWESEVEPAVRAAFEALIERLQRAGVEIIGREANADVAALEAALDGGFVERSIEITSYEMKWPYAQYVEKHGELIEKRVHERMAHATRMTPAHYMSLLEDKRAMRERARKVADDSDGFITLAASGPAPVGRNNTGSRTFLVYATFLGLPAFSLPLMTVEGMPLGAQLIGAAGADGALASASNWMMREFGQAS